MMSELTSFWNRSGEYKGNASCICWTQVYSEFAGPNRYEIASCVENTFFALRGPFSRRIALLGFLPTSLKTRRKKCTLSVSCGTIIWTTSWTDFPPKVEHHVSIAGIWETQVVNALLDGNRVIFHVNAYQSLVETTTNRVIFVILGHISNSTTRVHGES